MTSPLRLDEVCAGHDQLAHGPQVEGGTDSRRSTARERGRNVAGLWCVFDDPMEWGLKEAALGTAAALSALGLGPDIFGERK